MTYFDRFRTTALVLSAALALVGCGDDDDDTTMPMADMNVGTDMNTDPTDMGSDPADMGEPDPTPRGMANPPTLGSQIDRAGRPGVTTALVGTFTETDDDTREGLKDDYNANAAPASWGTDYAATIASQLAVIDGLDGTCGNQFAFDADPLSLGTENYEFLAAVLANDRLWVNAAKTNCDGAYLGVELETLGFVADGGCGGRIPSTDVIDITYSVLAAGLGAIDPSPAVGDGVAADDQPVAVDATFPFLSAP